MRNGVYAIYNGKEYSAGFKSNGSIVLRSADVNDRMDGFFYKEGSEKWKYFKYVNSKDIESIFKVTIRVNYQGHEGYVMTDDGNRVLIVINGLWPDTAAELEMDYASDNGIYEKWIDKDKVEMWEEVQNYDLK